MQTILNKKINKYFSYSQINTFLNCPQKYKLIYIDDIKTLDESIEAYMGKIVHEVLEWMYNKKLNYYVWDNIEDKYKEIWKKKWHSNIYIATIRKKYSKNYFMKLGLECLRNYYNSNLGPNIDTGNTIGNEIRINTKIGRYVFKGVIDRVDKNSDFIEIHDYKTGKPYTKPMIKKDMQLIIYLFAIKDKYPDKKVALNWHFLKNKEKHKQHIRIILGKQDILQTKNRMLSHIKDIELKIKNNNFQPNESFLCNWCYLWKNCEAKSKYNEINPSINAK